jgi:hypothetical protein
MRAIRSHNRRGFTLVEITVVTGLTVFLAVLLSSVWKNLNVFTTDAVGRGQLIQEMDMAAASLSRDLGGSLPIKASTSSVDADSQRPDQGRWIGWQHPSNSELWLCFDAGACPDGAPDWSGTTDTVIRYFLVPDPDANATTQILVRENRNTSTQFVVARNVNGMTVDVDPGNNFARIALQFRYQRHSGARYFGPEYLRAFTLEARPPQ